MKQIGLGTFESTPEMFRLVNQVLRSGRLSYGPMSQEFETRFSQLHGCKYGILSNSGTSSLLVALQTLKELHDWHDGDEVIVPALTFVATVNVVLQLRLKPVLVDIESDFYSIEPEDAIKSITDKTRAIIPVHTFGMPCDMFTLKRWYYADYGDRPLNWIEDSCEAMLVIHSGSRKNLIGTEYEWNPVGSWSDIACFSTYIAHLLVTGVGGISITNNPGYAKYMRSLVNHGISLDELPNGEPYDPSWLARKFTFDKIGHSFRITEIEAALGLAQLDTLPSIIKKRQDNADYLIQGLKDLENRLQLPYTRPYTENSRMMFPLVCLQKDTRDSLCRYLNERGIGTRLMLPLVSQPCYKGLWNPNDYPIAQWIDNNGYYIGCHQGLTQDDLDYVIEVHHNFFKDCEK